MIDHNSYEQYAQAWVDRGRGENGLMSGVALVALVCWHRDHAQAGDAPPLVGEYLAACEAVQPQGWYDRVLEQRAHCSHCSTRYRIENLSICTRCQDLYCYQCVGQCRRDEAGHRFCLCGGEVVG